MAVRRAIPIAVLILAAYVVFSVAWTFTEPLRVESPTPTRTPHPTYTPISAGEMLLAVTPSPSPSSTHTVTPSATATRAPTATPTPMSTAVVQARQHLVQSGDTLLGIAARYGIEYQALLDANSLADADVLSVGQMLSIPSAMSLPVVGERQHVVQAGDTMLGIALKYGADYDALLRLNGIVDPDHIYEGQVLLVPDG